MRPRSDIAGIAGSLVFIVVGALALYHTHDFTPLGSVFPRATGIAMIVLSCVYIAVTLLRPTAKAPQPGGSNFRRASLVLTMIAWAALIEVVGFLTMSVVAYASITVIANYDRWSPRLAVAFVASGAAILGLLYAVFSIALQVPLPAGMLL